MQGISTSSKICFPFTGHNLVPKSKSKDEARHGGTEKGCGNCKGLNDTQEFPGECQRYEPSQEKINDVSQRQF